MTERLQYFVLLFPVVGILLFVGGIAYRRRLKAKAGAFLQTYGTIVGNTQGLSGGFDTAPVYHPVIEYCIGSDLFSVTSDVGYGRRRKEGTKVAVIYNPANPSIAFTVQDYYTGANIMLAIGGAFLLLGSFIAYLILFPSQ